LQLLIGFVQILAGAFILPTEMAALPDIGLAIAAAGLFGALFKTEPVSHLSDRRHAADQSSAGRTNH